MTNHRFVLNLAPNGMIPTRELTPWVPITPAEVAEEALEAAEVGVTMVHLHARDPNTGEPSSDPGLYAEIVSTIRKYNRSLIVGISTSGRNVPDFESRSACLDLTGDARPDFASLTLSSLNFPKQASMNAPDMVAGLLQKMNANGIRPELEVFDLGMVNYAHYLIKQGLLKPPYYFNLLLGNIAGAQTDLMSLGLMVDKLPEGAIWAVAGIGDSQLNANVMGLSAGGGVRIGIEDNFYACSERKALISNKEQITRILKISSTMGLKPYSQFEARHLLGVHDVHRKLSASAQR